MLYELENRSQGHSKFYHIWAGAFSDKETGQAKSAFVGCKYGRIGTPGRTIFKDFTGQYCKGEALIYAEQKVQEKLNRGYDFPKELHTISSDKQECLPKDKVNTTAPHEARILTTGLNQI